MSADTVTADIFLIELEYREQDFGAVRAALARLIVNLPVQKHEAEAFALLAKPVITVYLQNAGKLAKSAVAAAAAKLAPLAADTIEVCGLKLIATHAGAAAGQSADYHYVVRTDVERGAEAELERWYDEEHMPMLAAVPGTVRARRLRSLDAKPRFYACYDLVSPGVLESAEWLRARQTPWSQQVRPTFRNTRRVISKRLPLFGTGVNPA